MYIYRAYQFLIHADFPIPEFPQVNETGDPDVVIRRGAVPTALENAAGKGVLYQTTANQFLLNMNDLARYLVQNGAEIVVEPAPNSPASDVRVFLLGSCLGALLHQRGILVLHAGALYTERGAVLFTGPSGIGKSTLLGELLRRGYKMMVDDVCGVMLDASGRPTVLPGYPRTRLWSDAAQKLEQDITTLERTRPAMEKYERQLPEQYWDQPAPLRRIYLLNTSNKDELFLTAEPRMDTFSIVLRNTYRQQFLDGLEMRAPHFSLVSAVAKQTTVTRVTRPSHPFRLTELADLIEQDLGQG
ncbi:MAG: hypothetical protein HY259_07150 [Chloroflexi bacterium]|nr:hypothetical protein [Chloroflexota bacterium]MBI3733222.1 hypothetical protein [Chloroflexota bacterium]